MRYGKGQMELASGTGSLGRLPGVFYYLPVVFKNTRLFCRKQNLIYNHHDPNEACILGLIGYWINITELIFAFFLLAFITLFATVIPDGYDDKVTAALTKK
jgi:hypothetical protein